MRRPKKMAIAVSRELLRNAADGIFVAVLSAVLLIEHLEFVILKLGNNDVNNPDGMIF